MDVKWRKQPEEHDYAAACHYLTLIMPEEEARSAEARLRAAYVAAGIVKYLAKDILRASGLALLPADNKHVAADLVKIRKGTELSPVLLLRGQPLVIGDGYHRVVASYWTDENTPVWGVIA